MSAAEFLVVLVIAAIGFCATVALLVFLLLALGRREEAHALTEAEAREAVAPVAPNVFAISTPTHTAVSAGAVLPDAHDHHGSEVPR